MRGWKFWLGMVIGITALAYFSRDLELSALAESWRRVHLLRYLEGVLWFCFSFWLRCPRWRILATGLGEIPFSLLSKAFFVGMLANRVLPARLGEVTRCVLIKKHCPVSLVGLLTTVAVEKAFDGMALLAVSMLALASLPPGELPAGIGAFLETHRTKVVASALGFPLVLVLLSGSLPWLDKRFWQYRAHAWHGPFSHALGSVFDGLGVMRKGRDSLAAAGLTALVWATLARSAYCAILSFGWELPFTSGIVLCAAIGLAVTVPQAPSFVGVYQVAVQWTLVGLYSVPLQEAKAFAVAIWVMQIIPVGIIGFVCLRLLGTSLSEASRTDNE
jgi:glycosyltransferase 2 family protein